MKQVRRCRKDILRHWRKQRRKGYAMELTGKVALVTGAGSGIGKATTVLLAKQGARIAALSHTADEIQATAEEIQRGGGEAMAVVADICQEEQMQRAVNRWLTAGDNSISSSPTRALMASG